MKIAIHHRKNSFSDDWINYCKKHNIPYKVVNCYSTDIVKKVSDCDALMWHFHHTDSRDTLFAKQLLYSLQTSGLVVFPDFNTGWHFNDKLGQKYLFESIDAPLVSSYVFYDKEKALSWISQASFPKVFKIRSGAGSSHVQLAESKDCARKLVKKSFGKGFSQYNSLTNLKERFRKFTKGKSNLKSVLKGILRLCYTTEFARVAGREKGYVYFQEFIPGNEFDIRVIVIGDKAFAIKRLVRKNDFRASGSGNTLYEKKNFDAEVVNLAFETAKKIKGKCLGFDFVYDNGKPLIVEVSFGYTKEVYEKCEGFWDDKLNWHPGFFNPQDWMIESVINEIRSKKTTCQLDE